MSRINGFQAQRLNRNLTIQETAQLSGVSAYTIRCCEEGRLENISMERLISLTRVLELSFAEACSFRESVGSRKRPRRREPRNVLENYMARWDLTVQGMAAILGVSAQTVSVQCGKEKPAMKYIKRLAEEENLPVSTFVKMYECDVWAPAV